MSKTTKKPWPKLSVDLPGSTPGRCQNCDATDKLVYWRECDNLDQPTMAVICLCERCSDRIIEPHPRLYRGAMKGSVMPGAMAVCQDCRFRERLTCQSPAARFNGGEGLSFEPPPFQVHLNCGRKSGLTGFHWLFEEPATTCTGKEPR